MKVDVTLNRNDSIGGSEAGIIAGVNNYKTAHELWLEKTGRKENQFFGNEATQRGKTLEPFLFNIFKEKFKDKYEVIYDDTKKYHKELEYMTAHVDGLIEEIGSRRKGILEIKTAFIGNKDVLKSWNDQIPQTYYCQLLHYMEVTGVEFAVMYAWLDVAWLDKQELRVYYFERKECQEDIDYLVSKEKEFWSMVQNDIEPEFINKEIIL